MKKLLSSMHENEKIRKILYVLMIVFMFLYTFSMPAFSGRSKWNIVSYFIMCGFAVVTVLYGLIYKKFTFKKRLLILPLFLIICLISTVMFSKEYRIVLTVFLLIITFFVYYYSFIFIENSRLIFKTIIFSFLCFSLYFIAVYWKEIIHFNANTRLGTYFDNVNLIGAYFSLSFTISLFIAVIFQKKREIFYVFSCVLFAFLGMLTGSRACIVLVAISLIVVPFIRLRKKWYFYLVYLGALVGLFFVIINIPAFSFLKEQFSKTIYVLFGIGKPIKSDGSTLERVVWQEYGYYLGGKNLIIGLGCGGFSKYSGIGTYAHSNFAEVLSSFGIIGFILFYLPFIYTFVLSFFGKKNDRSLVLVLFVYMFFRGFVGVSYNFKDTYLTFGLIYFLTDDVKMPHIYFNKSREQLENEK